MLAFLFFDLAWTSPAADQFSWFTGAVLVFAAVIGIGALVAIALFRNRERQRQFVVALQFAIVAFILVLYLCMYLAGDLHLMRQGTRDAGKIVAMVLPLVAYAFLFLARRGITNDIKLVRSMDRLR